MGAADPARLRVPRVRAGAGHVDCGLAGAGGAPRRGLQRRPADDPAHLFAADGVALDGGAIRHEAHRAGQAGLVEVWPPVVPKPTDDLPAWKPPVERLKGDSPQARLAGLIAKSETHGDITRARCGELASDLFYFGRPMPIDAVRPVIMNELKRHQMEARQLL